jgi:hypothetical protein
VIRAIAIMTALLLAATAAAGTRRVAVVLGNNAGADPKAALRYAELDADKLARVLVELGGVSPDDLYLLQGKDQRAVEAALQRAQTKIASYRHRGDRVVVIFYFSGHSDGVALELGRDRFTFAALRAWLKDTGGDVRIAVVDSCKSGALLAIKGGTPGPAFHIRLTDELASTGEAILTSSAADENALESREISGSFFTHHLVSGLRGAADTSGDGRVTLTEAYQYAYQHTLATSGETLAGPQHPTYDYKLSGEGELILTELAAPSASLALPDGFERALIVQQSALPLPALGDHHTGAGASDRVIAELGRGDPKRVAVEPGRYTVRVWRGGRALEASVALAANQAANQQRAVAWDELAPASGPATQAKSDAATHSTIDLEIAAGGESSVAKQLPPLVAMRVELRVPALGGASLALETGTRRAGDLRETSAFLFGGWRVTRSRGSLRASLGVEVGAGAVVQQLSGSAWTGAAAVAPLAELDVRITRQLALALAAHVPITALQADGRVDLFVLPAAWLGVIFGS